MQNRKTKKQLQLKVLLYKAATYQTTFCEKIPIFKKKKMGRGVFCLLLKWNSKTDGQKAFQRSSQQTQSLLNIRN